MRRYFLIFIFVGVSNIYAQLVDEDSIIFSVDTVFVGEHALVVCNETQCFPIASSSLIKERLKSIENKVPLTYNGYTKGFFDYFLIKKRSYCEAMLERTPMYFPIFEQYLKAYDMPLELKYLAIVESGLNPRAQSPAGAVGIWQFIKSTGQTYGLESNWYFEERMDFEKSTESAIKFLKDLYAQFGDWRLAIAAYNCGAGNVRKAKKMAGYSSDFWTIYKYLPEETRGYVPQFMAIMYTMEFAKEHGLYPDNLMFMPEYKYVTINSYFNLEKFAEMTNYCLDDILFLNPEIKRNVIIDSLNYALRLPIDVAEIFLKDSILYLDSCNIKTGEELNYKPRSYAGNTDGKLKTTYKVKSGDYLGKIASNYNVSVADLRKWNKLKNNYIYVGQTIVIWKEASYFKNSAEKENQIKQNIASNKILPIPENKEYTVAPGDTLWDIARKFDGVTVDRLKSLNKLESESIKVGQKLILAQ